MSLSARGLHEVLVSDRVGGGEAVAIRLASAGRRRGVPTTAWVPGTAPAAAALALTAESVPYRLYNLDAMRAGGFAELSVAARVGFGVGSFRRPVVHVHSPYVFGLLRRALLAARARVVVHVHIEPNADEVAWILQRPPAHIIACAHYIGEHIRRAIDSKRMRVPLTVVPNAVNLDRFIPGDRTSARAKLGMPIEPFVVLMLANLARHKGQETALRATRRLIDRDIPIECWLVGEDRTPGSPYGQELRSLAASLGIADAVRFLGFRKDNDVLLQAADALVLPSTHEGLPLCVLEAQAAGVPVIGSDAPGIREIVVDGVTGFVVPAGDDEGYAGRLQAVFLDRQLRRSLSEAARSQAMTEHTWPVFEERVFAIYESL